MTTIRDDEYRVPKLTSDNYYIWSIRAEGALQQRNLWHAIDPGFDEALLDANRQADRKAKGFLIQVVDDCFVDDIHGCASAKEAWEALKEMNSQLGILHILQLLRELINVEKKADESMQEYISRVVQIHSKLVTCQEGLDDRKLALVMLLGLPKSYEQLILSLEQDETKITTKIIKSRLLVEEKRQINRTTPAAPADAAADDVKALKVQSNEKPSRRRRPRSNYSTQKNVKCFCCGEFGHIAKDCPASASANNQRKDDGRATVSAANHLAKALMTRQSDKDSNKYVWALDSGATKHMTGYADKLTALRPHSSFVRIANGERVKVTGIGDAYFDAAPEHGGRYIVLKDVLLVPNLDENLISVRQIEQKNMRVVMENGQARVEDRKTSEVFLTATIEDDEYRVHEAEHRARAAKEDILDLWHKRLGHLHIQGIETLAKSTSINFGDKDTRETKCDVCIQGKATRRPFPKVATHIAEELLQRVHSDIMGPIEPASKGGSKYVITFIDEASGHVTVSFMKQKSEALEKFEDYLATVENKHDRRIKTLRTDNGREYLSSDFQALLRKKGIVHEKTVPYNPQQNGKAERENRTLMDMTRCLLIQSGLPKTMWAEALSTACYIRNRCPASALKGAVPIGKWKNKETDLSELRVFGCRAWMKIPADKQKSKLAARSIPCVFVGYPPGVKGYKLWNKEDGKFYISRDVTFAEDDLPLTKDEEKDGNQVVKDWPQFIPDETGLEDDETCQDEEINTNDNHTQEGENRNDAVAVEQIQQTGETRRSQRIARRRELGLVSNYSAMKVTEAEPKTVREALNGPAAEKWKIAMDEEIANHRHNHSFEIAPRPLDQKVIRSKWVFKIKKDEDGNITRYKGRLCAVGCTQKYGVDYFETFAPVIHMRTVRILVALGVELGWVFYQVDVVAAYLNEDVKETIYMEQPEHYEEGDPQKSVWLVRKSIYELKQAGRNWNICLNRFLLNCGLTRSVAEPCLYFNKEEGILVGDYVDDLMMIARDDSVADKFLCKIKDEFEVKSFGRLKYFLSVNFTLNSDGSMSLDQQTYIKSILDSHGMEDCKSVGTPNDASWKHIKRW